MGYKYKKMMLIMMILVSLFFVGCSKFSFDLFHASEEENNSVITLTPKKEDVSTEETINSTEDSKTEDSNVQTDSTPTPSIIQPTANIDVPIYSVNVNTGETETVNALVPADTEITPQLIVEKVVEAMIDRSIDIGIETVTTSSNSIIISFYKDKPPLSESGSTYEAAILDAIALSLMDNLVDYQKVIYRAEGGAYVSGHFEYGIDEPYLEDN